jgi:hypothetical protein
MTQENLTHEEKTIIITQNEGERFAHDHGGLALYGDQEQTPLQHEVQGRCRMVHGSAPEQPLVHLVCWDETQTCKVELSGQVELSGRVTLVGDEKAPLHVKMAHYFENDHHQTHVLEPMEHTLNFNTKLADPMHHAFQMRTPLQLRFCNPWLIASNYLVELAVGGTRLISIQVKGETTATPQPCEEIPCPPVIAEPGHP